MEHRQIRHPGGQRPLELRRVPQGRFPVERMDVTRQAETDSERAAGRTVNGCWNLMVLPLLQRGDWDQGCTPRTDPQPRRSASERVEVHAVLALRPRPEGGCGRGSLCCHQRRQ